MSTEQQLRKELSDLGQKVLAYLKHSSTDGKPIRQELRKNLKVKVEHINSTFELW